MTRLICLLAWMMLPLMAMADVAYCDSHIRITVIDAGTLRLEFAPDGQFVNKKSFVAVVRDYPFHAYTITETAKTVTLKTDKLKLEYQKGEGGFTADNLTISSTTLTPFKPIGKKGFSWKPGMKQQGNLKGTYRTLDGYNGDHRNDGTPIPLEDGLLSTDGWTLIDDSQGFLFNGDTDWDWVEKRSSAEGAQDWYFMGYGHDYKAALQSYTRFAGRVPMPPRYAFGYWWSRYWSYSDQDFRNLVRWFAENDIPLDVLVIDMDWHPISEQAGGGWTGWDWNENLFPDYRQFLKFLDHQGINATMNLHPADGVRPYEKKYQEFAQRMGGTDGKAVEWLGSDKKFVKALFETYLHPYMSDGVDFWWLDWQQWLNDKKVEGLSNTWWCNYLFFSDMQRQNDKRPMLYHRWGGLGNHRYQVGFSGDSYITWESLAFLPYFNSTASNVLYGYWSHDIGGHMSLKWGTPVPAELYTRAMQMGQYLPILRTHSTKDPALNKEPWAFDHATEGRLKRVIDGRYALVPYIYTMAHEDYETGVSLCRPMYYDYPMQQEAYDFQSQYMFGNDMMIAPIVEPVSKEDGCVHMKVWLPEGDWLEYETGTMLKGGQTLERVFTIDEYPVYVKAGSILPYYGKVKNLSGTEQEIFVRVFPGGQSSTFELYEDNGNDCDYATQFATTSLSYKREGNKLRVTIAARQGSYQQMPANRHYRLALPCALAPASIRLDGQPTAFTYDGYALETQADLGLLDCSRNHVVEVEYADADFTVADGTKARMAHITTTVANYKQQNAGMVYTDAVGFLEATPLRLTYFPKDQTQTLKQFNAYYTDLPNVLKEQMGDHPQSSWRPAGNRLKSAFTEQVNPANPLPEYPRPILTRGEWQNLNGLWNYAIISEDALCPDEFDGQILVPYPLESSLSGVQRKLRRDQVLWYERTFSVPKSWQGRDVLLHFGAVDHEAIVYVNGHRVASHVGGYTAFSANITSALQEGENRLTVRVIDRTEDQLQPVGKQRLNPGGNGSIWYTSISGIWQTVWMEPVAKQHITDIRTTPDLDASRFAVDVKTVGTNPSTDKVEVTLSYDGRVLAQGNAPTGQTVFLSVRNPQLWTPDSPNRYQMAVRLISNGKPVDQAGSYAAMRKISVAQQADGIWRLQLNNKNLFHFGPLDQGYWPDGLYTAPTDEALRFDIQKTKDWGFNMIRKHMKVEPARWYYYCDSIGILVWQDMPAVCRSDQYWDSRGWNRQIDGSHTPVVEANYYHEWGEIIHEFYSYPSIVVWTPFNEAWGQFKTPEVVEFTRQQDSSRLINPASGGNHYHAGDFLDLHDYARPPQLYLNDATRPVVLGEYGGLGQHIEGHRWVERDATTYINYKDAGELTDSYVEQGEAVLRMAKGIKLQDGTYAAYSAAVYTQTTDVETEVNGLMTYDRKVMKMDEARIRAINSAISHCLDK